MLLPLLLDHWSPCHWQGMIKSSTLLFTPHSSHDPNSFHQSFRVSSHLLQPLPWQEVQRVFLEDRLWFPVCLLNPLPWQLIQRFCKSEKQIQTERQERKQADWTPTSCDLGHDRRYNACSWSDHDRGRMYNASAKWDEGLNYVSTRKML